MSLQVLKNDQCVKSLAISGLLSQQRPPPPAYLINRLRLQVAGGSRWPRRAGGPAQVLVCPSLLHTLAGKRRHGHGVSSKGAHFTEVAAYSV